MLIRIGLIYGVFLWICVIYFHSSTASILFSAGCSESQKKVKYFKCLQWKPPFIFSYLLSGTNRGVFFLKPLLICQCDCDLSHVLQIASSSAWMKVPAGNLSFPHETLIKWPEVCIIQHDKPLLMFPLLFTPLLESPCLSMCDEMLANLWGKSGVLLRTIC